MARQYVGNSVPRTPAELADALSDPATAARVLKSSPEFMGEFKDKYIKNLMEDGSIAKQVAEQTQTTLGEFLKTNGGTPGRPPVPMSAGRSALKAASYSKTAPGASVEGIFADAAEMFQSVSWRAKHDRKAASRLAKVSDIQNSFGSRSARGRRVPGPGDAPQRDPADVAGNLDHPPAGDRDSHGDPAGAHPDDR